MTMTPTNCVPMDCKSFRKHHLAYLDDTLSGDDMRRAQHHAMGCAGCAAHDTLVRRSLLVARNLPPLMPSEQFQARLRARLAECRTECDDDRAHNRHRDDAVIPGTSLWGGGWRSPRMVAAVAAGAMLGVYAWQGWIRSTTPELSIQPVMASQSTMVPPAPYLTPELLQAMATGNPVWPAAMMVDDAPTAIVGRDATLATFSEFR
jgi:hypothetical protein